MIASILAKRLQKTILLFLLSGIVPVQAQRWLDKPVSVSTTSQKISAILQEVSSENGFYFSYNSATLPGDSLVSLNIRDAPLHQVLSQLLGPSFRFRETRDHVIIQRMELREKYTYITGTVYDVENAEKIAMASIYSRSRLLATSSNEDGTFRLRVKDTAYPLELIISRIGYADTLISIPGGTYHTLQIALKMKPVSLDEVSIYPYGGDRTWFARRFVSRSLREQGRNLGTFFVSLPYQVSLTPGLSTQGRMSTQITNHLSINLIGGYSAGVNGVEMAGMFNISRRNVRYLQFSGIFNVVSGSVSGIQLAGAHNHVLDSLNGVQASGILNLVKGPMAGVQFAGGINRSVSETRGLQAAGLANIAKREIKGVQLSGGVNSAHKVKGLQIGVVNIANRLRGGQIGVVNVADSATGYSIGVVNFIRNGKGELGISASDLAPFNFSWKTGTRQVYSFLTAGVAPRSNGSVYLWGMGLGKELRFSPVFTSAAEISTLTLFAGDFEKTKHITRLQTLALFDLPMKLRFFAGPALSFDFKRHDHVVEGYPEIPSGKYPHRDFGRNTRTWIGWQAGVSWRYGVRF